MPVEKMKKVNILSTSSQRENILSALRDSGLVEITELKQAPEPDLSVPPEKPEADFKHELAELASTIEFLEAYSKDKKSLIEAIIGYRIPVKKEDFLSTHANFNYKNTIKQQKVLSSKIVNLQSLLGKLEEERKKLEPWRSLDVKLSDLCGLSEVKTAVGRIPAKRENLLKKQLSENLADSELSIVKKTRTTIHFILFYHKDNDEAAGKILASSEFEKADLPECGRTPEEEIQSALSSTKTAKEELAALAAEAESLTRYKLKLMCVYDAALQKQNEAEAENKGAQTPYLFVIEGWATESSVDVLKKILLSVTREVELTVSDPSKDEIPPVVIKNPSHLGPFETITRIFGLPKYTEIDPTAVLSVFFLIFFGMCLSDAGYGFAMIIISWFMLKRLQLSAGGKKLLQLLMIGGVATIVIGALTGGWFGVELEKIPGRFALLKSTLLGMRMIDPIRNPLPILGISIGLGIISVLFGITINMLEKIKKGYVKDGILDEAPWLLFLGSIGVFIAGYVFAPVVASLAKFFILLGAISLIVTQGRHQKNIVMKFLAGVMSLYGSTGYMGDVLSHSRLLALGMSTAIIGMVINILASMAGAGLPGLGIIFMVLILIVGHTFNLLVAIMGAFIHSTRLELVEFFPKFFEGGGKEFKPYKRESKYTLLL